MDEKKSKQQWKLTHTSPPGTFQLANIRRVGEKPRVLDGTAFGLTPSSTCVLGARIVHESSINPDEKIVELRFIDLTTTRDSHWLNMEKGTIVLSKQKPTTFKFSRI